VFITDERYLDHSIHEYLHKSPQGALRGGVSDCGAGLNNEDADCLWNSYFIGSGFEPIGLRDTEKSAFILLRY
jgi:hypothetical protein